LDREIPIAKRAMIAEPLRKLIMRYPKQMGELVSEVIAICLFLASDAASDECFADQDIVPFVTRPIGLISQVVEPESFWECFWDIAKTDSVSNVVAVASAILSFIEEIPEAVCFHFPSLFEFAMNCMNSEHHMVVEGGLAVMFDLIGRNSEMLANFWPAIIDKFTAIIATAHEAAVRSALSVFSELLYVTEIDDALVPRAFTILFHCLHQTTDATLTALAALCKSAKEAMRPFIFQLVCLIEKVCSVNSVTVVRQSRLV
jgi:hypothetical protein